MSIPIKYQALIEKSKTSIFSFAHRVKRRAQGELLYDYLVPSGVYREQWDWDGFLIGMALASDIPSEAVYLKNWVLNFLHHARRNGYTPGCITRKGRDQRLNQMKPFLAQGAYFASTFLKDFTWLNHHYEKIKIVVLYRQSHLWDEERDLGVWFNAMESGADNNVAVLDSPPKTVVATDVNTFIHREYKAMSLIADALGERRDREYFSIRSRAVKRNINHYLWDDEDGIYYNVNRRDGSYIKRVSYNSLIPLWGKIADQDRAERFLKKYLLNPRKLWAKNGIRTLAKDDSAYNNRNIIKPYSNWQGPVWPVANYLCMQALLNYGFQEKAITLAKKIAKLVMVDIKRTGGMHENYHAETGKPLAAPGFIGWNLLVGNMVEEAVNKDNPFSL